MTWNQVFSRSLIGRDLQVVGRKHLGRGPIISVTFVGNVITFQMEWFADYCGKWKKRKKPVSFAARTDKCEPYPVGKCVCWHAGKLSFTIHPRGENINQPT